MDKVDTAIERLKVASEMSLAVYEQPLIITDSGGKDSSVITHLAIKAKIPCEIIHSHTTADAPETVYFVRDKFKRLEADGHCCKIQKPTYKGNPTSMWSLIPQKWLPPTRMIRYCCDILKETVGKNRMVATGVRWEESAKRADGRGIYEKNGRKGNQVILVNDNDDRRQLFENCRLKAKRTVNPIIDWTEREVWDYIHSEKISTNILYSRGWSRVGCVGCPLADRNNRIWEFEQFPKIENLYRITFERLAQHRIVSGRKYLLNAEELFLWWMEDENLVGQINIFDEDETESEANE